MNRYTRADDDMAEVKMAKIRERIRKNFPNAHAALQWRKQSNTRIVSHCDRFAIDRAGEGDAVRYTAILKPHSILAARLFTLEQAKEVCNRHASPLPLEPQQPALIEREPGSDDE